MDYWYDWQEIQHGAVLVCCETSKILPIPEVTVTPGYQPVQPKPVSNTTPKPTPPVKRPAARPAPQRQLKTGATQQSTEQIKKRALDILRDVDYTKREALEKIEKIFQPQKHVTAELLVKHVLAAETT